MRRQQEIFSRPYYLDQRSDVPEFSAEPSDGWDNASYTLIFEVRQDGGGEYYHLVTLWKASKEEHQLYEEYS